MPRGCRTHQRAESSSLAETTNAIRPLSPSRMELLSHEVPDYASQVRRWQDEAIPSTKIEIDGIGIRFFRVCIDALDVLLRHLDCASTKSYPYQIFRRCQAILKLWADNHAVWSGDLDRILDHSKNLQYMTVSVLVPMCRSLLHGLQHYVRDEKGSRKVSEISETITELYGQTRPLVGDGSDHDSDCDSDENIPVDLGEQVDIVTIAKDLKIYVDCLLDLTTALECPALDHKTEEAERIDHGIKDTTPQDYHIQLVLAKYPKAESELVECLGNVSWCRYQRMKEEREANVLATIHESVVGELQSVGKSLAAGSEFQDSGLGTSVPSAYHSYTETVVSFITSVAEGKRVKFPPLPAHSKTGLPFECAACGRQVKIVTNRNWRKHIFEDLQPYSCLYISCEFSTAPFANRQLWSNHVELDHGFSSAWETTSCPLCLEQTGSSKGTVLSHFARHLEDIALAAIPCDVELEEESAMSSDADESSVISQSSSTAPAVSVFSPYAEDQKHVCDDCNDVQYTQADMFVHLSVTHHVPDADMPSKINVAQLRWLSCLSIKNYVERIYKESQSHNHSARFELSGSFILREIAARDDCSPLNHYTTAMLEIACQDSDVVECVTDLSGETKVYSKGYKETLRGTESDTQTQPSPPSSENPMQWVWDESREDHYYYDSTRRVWHYYKGLSIPFPTL